jgi:hypothetical protein
MRSPLIRFRLPRPFTLARALESLQWIEAFTDSLPTVLLGFRHRQVSRCPTFVPMMKTANLRQRDHLPKVRRLHRPTPIGPDFIKPSPQESVEPIELWSLHRALQHAKLVTGPDAAERPRYLRGSLRRGMPLVSNAWLIRCWTGGSTSFPWIITYSAITGLFTGSLARIPFSCSIRLRTSGVGPSKRRWPAYSWRYPHGTSNKAGSKPISRRSDSSARLRLSFQSLHRGPDLLGRLPADVEDADEFQKRCPPQVPQALIPGAEEGSNNYWSELETLSGHSHLVIQADVHPGGPASASGSGTLT